MLGIIALRENQQSVSYRFVLLLQITTLSLQNENTSFLFYKNVQFSCSALIREITMTPLEFPAFPSVILAELNHTKFKNNLKKSKNPRE